MINHYKNILFDLDGTLIDTKSGVLGSLKKTMEELSLPLPPENRLISFLGPPLEQCFKDVCGLSEEQTQKAVTVFRGHYGGGGLYDFEIFEGIEELLAQLKKEGRILGVATSKNQRFAKIVMDHCGLGDFFDVVAGAPDSIETSWDKKDSVLKAMGAIRGADFSNTVLVGDRKFDAQGAAEAGIDAIGVLYGYGNAEELEASHFTAIAADIKQLHKLL
jgi:phosphoglycolate phosphatase